MDTVDAILLALAVACVVAAVVWETCKGSLYRARADRDRRRPGFPVLPPPDGDDRP